MEARSKEGGGTDPGSLWRSHSLPPSFLLLLLMTLVKH